MQFNSVRTFSFLCLHSFSMFLLPGESNPGHTAYAVGIPQSSFVIMRFYYSHKIHPTYYCILIFVHRPLTFCLPSPSLPVANLRVPTRCRAQPTAMSSQPPSSACRASSPVSLPYTQPYSSCSSIISASPACQFPGPSCTVSTTHPGR